jgi:hypothetical protein
MKPILKLTLPLMTTLILWSCENVRAASGSWTNNASGSWSTAANWDPNAIPGTAAGDVVTLTNNISAARTVTIDAGLATPPTAGVLKMGDSGSTYFPFTLAADSGLGQRCHFRPDGIER